MLRCELARAPGTAEEKNISSWLKGPRTRKENAGEDELWGPQGRRLSRETEGKGEKLGNVDWAGPSAVSHYQKWDGGTDERDFCNQSHKAGSHSSPVWRNKHSHVWSDTGHLTKTETREPTQWPHTCQQPTGKTTGSGTFRGSCSVSCLQCGANVTGLTGRDLCVSGG